jgi:hypothetical protein
MNEGVWAKGDRDIRYPTSLVKEPDLFGAPDLSDGSRTCPVFFLNSYLEYFLETLGYRIWFINQ